MLMRKRTLYSKGITQNYQKIKCKANKRHVLKNKSKCKKIDVHLDRLLINVYHDRKNSWDALFNKFETCSDSESVNINYLHMETFWEKEYDESDKSCDTNSVNHEKESNTQSTAPQNSSSQCFDGGIKQQDSVNNSEKNHFGNQNKDSSALLKEVNNGDLNLKPKDINGIRTEIGTPILHQNTSLSYIEDFFSPASSDSGIELQESVTELGNRNSCENQDNNSSTLLQKVNEVHYSLRHEDIDRRAIVERPILQQKINLSSKEIGSSKITERIKECESINSKDSFCERSKTCQDYNYSHQKIDSKCAKSLQISREIPKSSNIICFQNKIPLREDSVTGCNISSKQVDSLPKQNCSENKIAEVLVFLENKIPSFKKNASLGSEICSVSTFSEKKLVPRSRSENRNVKFCNPKEDGESKENNGGKKYLQNENSSRQVPSNELLECDFSGLKAIVPECVQDNITSVSHVDVDEDSHGSDSSSCVSSCDKQMVNDIVSKQELCSNYQNAISSNAAFSFSAAPRGTHICDRQNERRNVSCFDDCEISFPNASLIKMPIKRKFISKEIMVKGDIDENNAKLSQMNTKKDCERKIEEESNTNSKKNNEKEKKYLKIKSCSLKRNPLKIGISEQDLKLVHFFTNQWEEFVKKPGSVLIPIPKKKKYKLPSLDWKSIMNGK